MLSSSQDTADYPFRDRTVVQDLHMADHSCSLVLCIQDIWLTSLFLTGLSSRLGNRRGSENAKV